jgi:hypothetical protein
MPPSSVGFWIQRSFRSSLNPIWLYRDLARSINHGLATFDKHFRVGGDRFSASYLVQREGNATALRLLVICRANIGNEWVRWVNDERSTSP